MRLLGIDYGLSTVGLSFAAGPLAEPLGQKRYQVQNQLFDYLTKLINRQKIEQIVIGLSEGDMAQKTLKFGNKLKNIVNLPVVYQDETLSSFEAKAKLIQARAPQKKRRLNHQAAATLILQHYLDSRPQA